MEAHHTKCPLDHVTLLCNFYWNKCHLLVARNYLPWASRWIDLSMISFVGASVILDCWTIPSIKEAEKAYTTYNAAGAAWRNCCAVSFHLLERQPVRCPCAWADASAVKSDWNSLGHAMGLVLMCPLLAWCVQNRAELYWDMIWEILGSECKELHTMPRGTWDCRWAIQAANCLPQHAIWRKTHPALGLSQNRLQYTPKWQFWGRAWW